MCLPIIGGIISGIGAAVGAAGQAAGHKADAAMQRRQMRIEHETGAYEGARTSDGVKRVLGQARSSAAANGLAIGGSVADVIDESAQEGALDVAAIRWNSGIRVDNANYRARVSDMNAKIAGAAVPVAFLSPVISGVARYTSNFQEA